MIRLMEMGADSKVSATKRTDGKLSTRPVCSFVQAVKEEIIIAEVKNLIILQSIV